MSDWLDWLLARMGEPIPCEICRTPTPPGELTETTVPGAVTELGLCHSARAKWHRRPAVGVD